MTTKLQQSTHSLSESNRVYAIEPRVVRIRSIVQKTAKLTEGVVRLQEAQVLPRVRVQVLVPAEGLGPGLEAM